MTDILHLLTLREAYRTGIIDRDEFLRRSANAEWNRFLDKPTGDGTIGKPVQIDRQESSDDK